MRKGHSITGLNVIGHDGAHLGKVLDLIFDHDADECIGLVLKEKDLFGLIKPQVVAWSEIATIGKDAVMVRSADSVIQPKDDARIDTVMQRGTHLSGTKIYSEDGTEIGTFGDVYIDETSGVVLGYEVSGGFVADTMSGERYMGVPSERTIGDNVMIVPTYSADDVNQQAQNEPGGVKGAFASAGDKVSDVYGTAKDKVSETYASVAGASIEQQKEFVVGKVAANDVFLPAETTAATTNVESIVPTSDTSVINAVTIEPSVATTPAHRPLLVAKGATISSEQANQAEVAGILHALVLAAGGGIATGAYDSARDKVSSATEGAQDHLANAGQSAEAAAIGKPAATEVNLSNGSTLLAPGMIVTQAIMDTAKVHGKEKEVIASAGLGAAAEGAQNVAATAQQKAGNLWDTLKEKTAELTGTAQEKKDELDEAAQQRKINNALGRPVTRVILAQDDSVILNTGDLITHKAVNLARENEALDILLDSVYDEEPEITPEMMRVEGKGTAALPSQQEPTGAAITATVLPDQQPQIESA